MSPTGRAAILFSGGTDSTAASALMAEQFAEIDLLTYTRVGFSDARNARNNAARLARRFPDRGIRHAVCETTALAEHLTMNKRWSYVRRYGFFTLQQCGFCALANQIGTMAWCLHHGFTDYADGITHDWPFFPGHMDRVIELFREFASGYGLTYHTPVLSYDVDPAVPYITKAVAPGQAQRPPATANTTGRLLKRLGLSDTENYKGTERDRQSQARCYQFVLPNLFIYWVYGGPERWPEYERTVLAYFGELLDDARGLLDGLATGRDEGGLFAYLANPAELVSPDSGE
jgi:hypothetical protein